MPSGSTDEVGKVHNQGQRDIAPKVVMPAPQTQPPSQNLLGSNNKQQSSKKSHSRRHISAVGALHRGRSAHAYGDVHLITPYLTIRANPLIHHRSPLSTSLAPLDSALIELAAHWLPETPKEEIHAFPRFPPQMHVVEVVPMAETRRSRRTNAAGRPPVYLRGASRPTSY